MSDFEKELTSAIQEVTPAIDQLIADRDTAMRFMAGSPSTALSAEEWLDAFVGYGEQIIRSHYAHAVNRFDLTTKEYAEHVMREIFDEVSKFAGRERARREALAVPCEWSHRRARDGQQRGDGMSDFEKEFTSAIQASILATVRKADFVRIEYNDRPRIDAALMAEAQKMVNRERIREELTRIVETRMADAIWNAMATELATDMKKVLSDMEMRAEIRVYLREKMRGLASGLTDAPATGGEG